MTLAAAALALGQLVGCGGDSFTPAAGDASLADSAADAAAEAAPHEAGGADAAQGDGEAPESSVSESGPDGQPEAAVRLCAPPAYHGLCDDFDDEALSPLWTPSGNCAQPALTSDDAHSAPHALLSAKPSGNRCAAFDRPILMLGTGVITCEFDVKAQLSSPGERLEYFAFVLESPSYWYYQVTVSMQGYGEGIIGEWGRPADGAEGESSWKNFAADLQGWRHVKVSLDLSKRVAKVEIEVAPGQLVTGEMPMKYGPDADAIAGAHIYLGATDGPVEAAQSVRHDNIVCDSVP